MWRNHVFLFWLSILSVCVFGSCTSKVHYANFSKTHSYRSAQEANSELSESQEKPVPVAQITGKDSLAASPVFVSAAAENHPTTSQKSNLSKKFHQQKLKPGLQEIKKLIALKKRILADEDPPKRKIPVSVYLSVIAAAVSILSLFLISSAGAFVFLWLFSTFFGFICSIAAIEYVNRKKSEFKGQGFAILALLVCGVQLAIIIALFLFLSGGNGH